MQAKIIQCLKKAGEPLGRAEIAKRIKARPITVSDRLKKLVRCGEVICMELDHNQAMERFNSKRRTKIYYLP